jgi:hypothetical protein
VTLLSGCSSLRVATDYSAAADFSEIRTYQYRDTGQTAERKNQLVHDRIVAALHREAQASGLTETESNPDVLLGYYVSVDEQLVLNTTHMGYGWGPRWGTMGMGSSMTTASTHVQGTLVIDMWDDDEDQLVWRAIITDTVRSNPDQNADRINRGIASAFADFPPTPGS